VIPPEVPIRVAKGTFEREPGAWANLHPRGHLLSTSSRGAATGALNRYEEQIPLERSGHVATAVETGSEARAGRRAA